MQNGGEQEAVQNVQYVIVLGCKLEGEEPGRCLAARIERATNFLLKNPAFVTNDFHLYRSRRLAKYVGFTAIGLCAPTPRDILLPNLIREVCSVIVSCIRFRT